MFDLPGEEAKGAQGRMEDSERDIWTILVCLSLDIAHQGTQLFLL